MERLTIELRTLTPLWTGGVDQTVDRLHETGLIGSLRWWYEALVRGLGGYACDPTEHGCIFDEEKYRKSKANDERHRLLDAGVCDACQLFGCTGWARKFRITVSDADKLFESQSVLIPSGRIHQTRQGKPRAGGWYLQGESQVGDISLAIIPLREPSALEQELLNITLTLIAKHGTLAAKVSNGYGVISGVPDIVININMLRAFAKGQPRSNASPDLRDFFFAKFNFDEPADPSWWKQVQGIREVIAGQVSSNNQTVRLQGASEIQATYQKGILPIAPAIRNWLRYLWQHGLNQCQEHYVFGEARSVCPRCCRAGFKKDNRDRTKFWCPHCRKSFDKGSEKLASASKVNISYAYKRTDSKWEFRVWGWLPCAGEIEERDQFLNALKNQLTGNSIWQTVLGNNGIIPHLTEWHTFTCDKTDGRAYLYELLGGAE
jgi:CRISPR-associated protein Cmr1